MNFKTILTHTHPSIDGKGTVNADAAVGEDGHIYRRFTWANRKGKVTFRADWHKDETLRIVHVTGKGKKEKRTYTERTADEFFNSLRAEGWNDKLVPRKKSKKGIS
jgi:hypothetical protein